MSSLPPKASRSIRQAILDALRDRNRRFIDDRSSTIAWLTSWGIRTDGFFDDLIEALEGSDLLFFKPKTTPQSPQAYQCILNYAENGEYAAVVVHVTLAPKGQPPRVRVAVHPSDTAKTLPALRTF